MGLMTGRVAVVVTSEKLLSGWSTHERAQVVALADACVAWLDGHVHEHQCGKPALPTWSIGGTSEPSKQTFEMAHLSAPLRWRWMLAYLRQPCASDATNQLLANRRRAPSRESGGGGVVGRHWLRRRGSSRGILVVSFSVWANGPRDLRRLRSTATVKRYQKAQLERRVQSTAYSSLLAPA